MADPAQKGSLAERDMNYICNVSIVTFGAIKPLFHATGEDKQSHITTKSQHIRKHEANLPNRIPDDLAGTIAAEDFTEPVAP